VNTFKSYDLQMVFLNLNFCIDVSGNVSCFPCVHISSFRSLVSPGEHVFTTLASQMLDCFVDFSICYLDGKGKHRPSLFGPTPDLLSPVGIWLKCFACMHNLITIITIDGS